MKKLISYTLITLAATVAISIAAPSRSMMMGKEKAAWQAFNDKDAAAFQKLVDHDVVGIYSDGISGMQDELDGMKKWNMKSFKISDFKSHSDEKDVCVTSYKIKVTGSVDGKDASGTYYAGSVWKVENGQWLVIFHTNIEQAGSTTRAKNKE